jgi:hypothetical protein
MNVNHAYGGPAPSVHMYWKLNVDYIDNFHKLQKNSKFGNSAKDNLEGKVIIHGKKM